jgi:hypothetical protein
MGGRQSGAVDLRIEDGEEGTGKRETSGRRVKNLTGMRDPRGCIHASDTNVPQ